MKGKKLLHHIFFGFVGYLGAAIALAPHISGVLLPLTPLTALLVGMCILLLAAGKICTYGQKPGASFFPAAAIGFALLLGLCVAYGYITGLLPGGGDIAQPDSYRVLMTLLLGGLFLWVLFLHFLLHSKELPGERSPLVFLKDHVTAFLVFRAGMVLFSLVSALVVGRGENDTQNTYFLFVLDDSAVQSAVMGNLSGSGSFMAGMTAASSFFMLSTLAREALTGKAAPSFFGRVKRMFLEVDTFKLLAMTLVSIVCSFLDTGILGFWGKFLSSFLVLFWIVGLILFLAETKALDYLIHAAALGFVENLIPVPELTGVGGFLASLGVTAVRIVLFALIAWLIAGFQLRKGSGKSKLFQITFMDIILFIVRVSEQGLRGLMKTAPAGGDEQDVRFIVSLVQKSDAWLQKLLKVPAKETE